MKCQPESAQESKGLHQRGFEIMELVVWNSILRNVRVINFGNVKIFSPIRVKYKG